MRGAAEGGQANTESEIEKYCGLPPPNLYLFSVCPYGITPQAQNETSSTEFNFMRM